MKISNIDHINLYIKDINDTIQFYQELFGFEVKERSLHKGREHAILGRSGSALLAVYELAEDQEFSLENQMINHFGFVTENFEESFKIAKEKGILGWGNGITNHENSRSFYILDPSGHEIEISEKFGGGL